MRVSLKKSFLKQLKVQQQQQQKGTKGCGVLKKQLHYPEPVSGKWKEASHFQDSHD